MSNKHKILAALDCALDDISEERLLDILLDAYLAKKEHIKKLEGENAHERLMLRSQQESMKEDHHRMRTDPLYCANRYRVSVQGYRIDLFVRRSDIEFVTQPIPLSDFIK